MDIKKVTIKNAATRSDYMKAYYRTPYGWASKSWAAMRNYSKARNHQPPEFSSKDDFIAWVSSQPNFDRLWQDYEKSGFDSAFKPSVDRLNNRLHYRKDNIRLVTWKENHLAPAPGRWVEGTDHYNSKLSDEKIQAIRYLWLSGRFTQEALSRVFDISQSGVNDVVNQKTWKHLD